MKYLHRNDVIIRNLRPETIVFDDPDSLEIRLVDLSLAVRKEDYVNNSQDYLFEEY